jgi:hypothetical protein
MFAFIALLPDGGPTAFHHGASAVLLGALPIGKMIVPADDAPLLYGRRR